MYLHFSGEQIFLDLLKNEKLLFKKYILDYYLHYFILLGNFFWHSFETIDKTFFLIANV